MVFAEAVAVGAQLKREVQGSSGTAPESPGEVGAARTGDFIQADREAAWRCHGNAGDGTGI
jgi:hypothetical protein